MDADAGGAGAGPGVVCSVGVVDWAAATGAKQIKEPKQATALTPHANPAARFEEEFICAWLTSSRRSVNWIDVSRSDVPTTPLLENSPKK